ncbi:MAG: AlkZ family DNA glycosylase [Anaerolineales bacterium]|nr:AlkZ family DNA glycosylase [Anaerolineales bacterium]
MEIEDIALRRLRYQHLAAAPLAEPVDVVRWLTAVQAQDYYGALWSLGQRLKTSDEAQLDAAFNTGAILRTHLLRPTWHFVAPEDIRWLLQLTGPRVHQRCGTGYRQLELDDATRQRCHQIIIQALAGGKHLTRHELGQALVQAGIQHAATGRRLTYIVMSAELDGVLCSGPRRGKQFTYALLEEWVPPAPEKTAVEALAELTRRYFQSHGPATVHDFANWSGLTVGDGRIGLDLVQKELEHTTINEQTYWFSPKIPATRTEPPRAYILSVFDEYFIGYKDRRAIANQQVTTELGNLGNGLTYILVLDGQIIGSCRRTVQSKSVTIEMNNFLPLNPAAKQAVAHAAQQLGKFLDLTVDLTWT